SKCFIHNLTFHVKSSRMKRCSYRNLTIFFFFIGVSLRLLHAQNLDSQVEHSLEFARQQLIRTVTELQDTSFYRIKIER
ncbi:MAG: hypothetical protein KAW56_07670, partial [Candidatus Marinimicrobia bacterium]|nr:hypothetical protein [Candidatus Neomarinimicrobiota bacterium]